MSLSEQISSDLRAAMKAKAELKVSTLRQLVAAINNELIAQGKKEEGLKDEEIVKVVKREIKKRQDAREQYSQAGRSEQAEQEGQELGVLATYMPEQMSDEDVRKIVEEVIKETGANSPGQFGQIMGAVMKKAGGQADGKVVSKLVKDVLQDQE